jgi:hypothetical protein
MNTYTLRDNRTWQDFLDALMKLRDGEKRWEVTVKPYRKKRSSQANAFYWSCVVTPLAEFAGYTPDEMHEEILMAYTGTEVREFNGHRREFPKRRTTTPDKMDTMDFKGLIETGQRIAATLGVRLPDQETE